MKIKSIKCFTFLIILLLFNACKEYNELVPDIEGIPSGGVLGAETISMSGDELEFQVDLFVVNSVGNYIRKLELEHFEIASSTVSTISQLGVEYIKEQDKGPYSAALLMDQSGSIDGTDPSNARVPAAKAFVDIMGTGDQVALAQFSGSYFNLERDLLVPFSENPDIFHPLLDDLINRNNGSTPLYRAIASMVNYTQEKAKNSNKAIIVFTDGEDTEGGSVSAIVNEANNNDISIYIVGLGSSVNQSVLADIAYDTGGALMFPRDALQLISLYSSLGELLNGNAKFYRTTWKARKNIGEWQIGEEFLSKITVNLPDNTIVEVPFKVRL